MTDPIAIAERLAPENIDQEAEAVELVIPLAIGPKSGTTAKENLHTLLRTEILAILSYILYNLYDNKELENKEYIKVQDNEFSGLEHAFEFLANAKIRVYLKDGSNPSFQLFYLIATPNGDKPLETTKNPTAAKWVEGFTKKKGNKP